MAPILWIPDVDVIHMAFQEDLRSTFRENHAPYHVSVMIHLDLVELQGPHRFGNQMGHLALFTGQTLPAYHFPAKLYQFIFSFFIHHDTLPPA
jgi:hypothetical protein